MQLPEGVGVPLDESRCRGRARGFPTRNLRPPAAPRRRWLRRAEATWFLSGRLNYFGARCFEDAVRKLPSRRLAPHARSDLRRRAKRVAFGRNRASPRG